MRRIYNVTLIMIVETLHLLTRYQPHILSLLSSPSPCLCPSPYSSSPQITRMAIISFLKWQTGMHCDIW